MHNEIIIPLKKIVDEIQNAVRQLSPSELGEFRQWFAEFDAVLWDKQIELDAAAGRLDQLAAEAIKELKSGKAPRTVKHLAATRFWTACHAL